MAGFLERSINVSTARILALLELMISASGKTYLKAVSQYHQTPATSRCAEV